jgi:hypothetical protein
MESRQQVGTVCTANRTEWMLTAAPNRPALKLLQNASLDAALRWGSNGELIFFVCIVYVCVPTANCTWLLLYWFKLQQIYFFSMQFFVLI